MQYSCRKYLLNLRHIERVNLNKTIEIKVLEAINDAPKGAIFFVESFLSVGNSRAVNKSLERLVAKALIIRVAQGIYTRPKQSALLGNIMPSVEEIATAIAGRDKARIVPTGIFALNALGLSTQIPLNAVYLTDGAARKIQIGKRNILFKKTTPKNLSAIGNISKLVIQALKSIGINKVTADEEKQILDLLKKEKRKIWNMILRLLPNG